MNYSLGFVLLSILIMNMWKNSVVEGMAVLDPAPYSPKPPAPEKTPKPIRYKKEIAPMCTGGFVLPGFPYTMQ